MAVLIIKILRFIAMAGISVSFFIGVFCFLKKVFGEEARKEMKKEISRKILEDGRGAAMRLEMSRYGILYRMEDYDMSPMKYVSLKAMGGIGLFTVLMLLGVHNIFTILAIPIGYFGVPALFKALNKSDNGEMLTDIFNTYANINIQLKVGQYIASALEYSYHTAKNKRYKEAMGELVLNMADKTVTTEESLKIFQNRFASNEIDKLCTMLRSLIRYGNNDDFSHDLLDEIKSIISADAMKAQNDIETKSSMVSFGFFGVVILMVVISVMLNFDTGGMFSF